MYHSIQKYDISFAKDQTSKDKGGFKMEKESDYNSVEFKPSIPELQLDALTTD